MFEFLRRRRTPAVASIRGRTLINGAARSPRAARGQTLVEFGLVFGGLMTLLLGGLMVGMILFQTWAVERAAGALGDSLATTAVFDADSQAAFIERANSLGAALDPERDTLAIVVAKPEGGIGPCGTNQCSYSWNDEAALEYGDIISVRVEKPLDVPGFDGAMNSLFGAFPDVAASWTGVAQRNAGEGTPSTPQQTGVVQGTIYSASTGLPLTGVEVRLDTGESTITDSNGFYRIEALLPGSYTLVASKGGYLPSTAPVTVSANSTTTVDLSLNGGVRIIPVVVPSEDAISYDAGVLATPDLLGYWRLGEDSGSTALDASGNGLAGTYSNVSLGQPALLAGEDDAAAGFNGSSSLVTIPGAPAYGPARTIAAWVSFDDPAADGMIAATGSASYLRVSSERAVLAWHDSTGTGRSLFSPSGSLPADGEPHFVVGTHDGNTARLYIDGVQVASDATYDAQAVSPAAFYVGRYVTATYYFDGVIDDVALFDRALSLAEIQSLHTAGTTGNDLDLTANGDFEASSAWAGTGSWATSSSTFAFSAEAASAGSQGGRMTTSASGSANQGVFETVNTTLSADHTYAVVAMIKAPDGVVVQGLLGNSSGASGSASLTGNGEFQPLITTWTPAANANNPEIVFRITTPVTAIIDVDEVLLVDVTDGETGATLTTEDGLIGDELGAGAYDISIDPTSPHTIYVTASDGDGGNSGLLDMSGDVAATMVITVAPGAAEPPEESDPAYRELIESHPALRHYFRLDDAGDDSGTGVEAMVAADGATNYWPLDETTWSVDPEKYADEVLDTPGLVGYWRLDENDTHTFSEYVHENGPYHYYRLHERTGTNQAVNSAATYVGGVTRQVPSLLPGDPDPAAQFDGVDDRLDIPDPNTSFTRLTMMGWIKPSNVAKDQIFITYGSAANYLRIYNQKLFFSLNIGGTQRSFVANTTLVNGQTYFAVGTYDGTTMRIYLNGQLDGSLAVSGNVLVAAGESHIGQWLNSDPQYRYVGVIDEVSIWGKAISATLIGDMYAARTASAVAQAEVGPDGSYYGAGDPAQSAVLPGSYGSYSTAGNGWVDLPESASFPTTGDLSLEWWMTTANLNTMRQNPIGDHYLRTITFTTELDGSLTMYWPKNAGGTAYYGVYILPAGSLVNGQTYHIVVNRVVASRYWEIWVNGRRANIGNWVAGEDPIGTGGIYGNNWRIGYTYASIYQGRIDEVAMYTTPMSPERVQRHWMARQTLDIADTIGGSVGWLAGGNSVSTSPMGGNARDFDGVDDGAIADINLSDTAVVTLEWWGRWDAISNNDDFFFEYGPDTNTYRGFYVDPNSGSGNFRVVISDPGTSYGLYSFARPPTGWHHYALTIDRSKPLGSEVSMYVDSVAQSVSLDGGTDSTGNFGDAALHFMYRAKNQNLFGDGGLQHVTIYKKALSAAEVGEHFRATGFTVLDSAGDVVGRSGAGMTAGVAGGLVNDFDTAMSFDGSGYITATLPNLGDPFSVEAFVQPAQTSGSMTVISTRGPADIYNFDFKLVNGELVHGDIAEAGGGAWITFSADAALNYIPGEWYHIVYTVDENNGWHLYINGYAAASGSLGGEPADFIFPGQQLFIGSCGPLCPGEEFVGVIDEVSIYADELTPAEVFEHYQTAGY